MTAQLASDPTQLSINVPITARRRWGPKRVIQRALPPLASAVVVIGIWTALGRVFGVAGYLLPPPDAVLRELIDGAGPLLAASLVTVQAAYLGFLISVLIGVPLALAMATWAPLEASIYPYLVIMQTTPIIAIAPLLVVALGAGARTNMLIVLIICFFPVTANTVVGLKSTDRNLVALYRMTGASRLDEMLTLRLPYAMPYFFVGLRIAGSVAVIGAIVGEFVAGIGGGRGGLGFVIIANAIELQTAHMIAAVVASCVLSLTLFGLITLAGYFVLRPWHESSMAAGE